MEEIKNQNVQEQKDNTPKWIKAVYILTAIAVCLEGLNSFTKLFGDAPGQCIKNRSRTRNYKKMVDIDFNDFVRRDQYIRNRRKNG